MHIAVIGTGYVGLVSGACFAEFGVTVTCVDVDTEKIESLISNIIPIYEPGLDKIVEKNVEAGRLHFTTDIKSAVEQAQVVFLAVGTPPKEDGSPDMSYYRQAAKDVADAMNGYKVLVTKSTVPVGTGKWLREFRHRESGYRKRISVLLQIRNFFAKVRRSKISCGLTASSSAVTRPKRSR